MQINNDILIKAVTDDGKILGYFANTKNSLQNAALSHNMNIISKAIYARAMTASVLLSGNLKNSDDYLTLSWECSGPVKRIVIDTDYNGNIRGYMGNNTIDFIEGTIQNGNLYTEQYIGFGELVVSRKSFRNTSPYNSITVLETGEIAEDINVYLEQSLQTDSIVNLAININGNNEVEASGGLMLIALPGANKDEIKKMYDSFNYLGSLKDILKNNEIDKITEYLSHNKLSVLSKSTIQFKCRCNEDYIKSVLRSLDEKTILDFKEDDDTFKVTCQYCGKNYIIAGDIMK